jgi:putative ABC transport system ATP-binding protein
MFHVNNLSFSYFLGKAEFRALQDVSLHIPDGDFITLAGPSGSGKSTLLSILGLIENSPSKSVFYRQQDIHFLNEANKNQLRRHEFGFIFQHFYLFPVLSAYENVEYFLIKQGLAAAERKTRVEWALETVGLKDLSQKKPNELSGGQRQRVAIARALAKKPQVIIADEPTASLDSKTGRSILDYLLKINQDSKVTIIMASHDEMVLSASPRIIRLHDGKLES